MQACLNICNHCYQFVPRISNWELLPQFKLWQQQAVVACQGLSAPQGISEGVSGPSAPLVCWWESYQTAGELPEVPDRGLTRGMGYSGKVTAVLGASPNHRKLHKISPLGPSVTSNTANRQIGEASVGRASEVYGAVCRVRVYGQCCPLC